MDYPAPDGPPPDLLRSGERGENGIDIRGHGLVLVDLFLCLLKILSFRNQSDIRAVLSVVNGRKLNDLLAGPVLILYIIGDGEQLAAVSLVRYSADENISVIGRSDIITAFPGRGELDFIIMGTGERNRLASKGGSLFTALFMGGLRTGIVVLDVVIFVVICTVLTILSMTTIHAVTARLKIEHLFKFYWTFVAGMALLSLVLVWFGL